MFQLELKFQNLVIKQYSLQDGQTLIVGRDPGNDIVIRDPTVSRHHACIARKGGALMVWDKGSSNGIVVNGVRVHSAKLANGDVITIGAKYALKASMIPTQKKELTITAAKPP